MRAYWLTIFLIFAPPFANAKPQITIQMTAHCEAYAKTVQTAVATMPNLPEWHIVIACNEPNWFTLQKKGRAERTNTAFTNIDSAVTVIRWKVIDDPIALRLVLAHELEHLRCKCSLGERQL